MQATGVGAGAGTGRRERARRAAAKPACRPVIAWCAAFAFGAALSACGGDSADLSPVRLRHDPPIGQLTDPQLRSLSMECEKFTPHQSMRGRYDAAYCEQAMAAWADAPLQMVPIDANRPSGGPAPARQPDRGASVD